MEIIIVFEARGKQVILRFFGVYQTWHMRHETLEWVFRTSRDSQRLYRLRDTLEALKDFQRLFETFLRRKLKLHLQLRFRMRSLSFASCPAQKESGKSVRELVKNSLKSLKVPKSLLILIKSKKVGTISRSLVYPLQFKVSMFWWKIIYAISTVNVSPPTSSSIDQKHAYHSNHEHAHCQFVAD